MVVSISKLMTFRDKLTLSVQAMINAQFILLMERDPESLDYSPTARSSSRLLDKHDVS